MPSRPGRYRDGTLSHIKELGAKEHMLPFQWSRKTRFLIFLTVTALSLVGGLFLHGLSLAAVYFAVLPASVGYVVALRPDLLRHVRYYHILYVLLLTAMVTAYLMSLARTLHHLRIVWTEVPIAVWFLLTMHVVVWLLDRAVNAVVSKVFRAAGVRTALRLACIVAVAAPYVLALFAVHWVKFADNDDPQRECSLPFEHVRFTATDGVPLDGWFLPLSPTPAETTVILVPGRGMPKAGSLYYAQILAMGRCNVLLFDLRGEGGSSGHSRSFGVREVRDVLGAVQFLEQNYAAASKHLYAFGVSQGASAVIRAAAQDQRVRAVVVDSTLTVAQDLLPARVLAGLPAPLRVYLQNLTCAFASAELGCNLFRELDLAPDMAKLSPRPLLVIHGAADTVSSPQEATKLFEAAGQPKCLDMVPGAGHGDALFVEGTTYLIRILQIFSLAERLDSAS